MERICRLPQPVYHSAYDLFYLILARRTGATLFTLDNKLIDLAKQCGVECAQSIEYEEY